MRTLTLLLLALSFSSNSFALETNEIKLKVDLDQSFVLKETNNYSIELIKELPLRFSDVLVKPKGEYKFSMMLSFICDTPDLSKFDTPEKIDKNIKESSKKYLPYTLEKDIVLQPFSWEGRYGCITKFTDKKWATTDVIPNGEFKYISRGMIRLSNDTILGFRIMTNEMESENYRDLIAYVRSIVINPLIEKKHI